MERTLRIVASILILALLAIAVYRSPQATGEGESVVAPTQKVAFNNDSLRQDVSPLPRRATATLMSMR